MSDPLLEAEGVIAEYPVGEGLLRRGTGVVRAVDGVSLTVRRGETLGIVGESGCGKSTLARTLLRLEEPAAGTIRFDGEPVCGLDGAALKRFRRRAQMTFQDPRSSFDPRRSVGESVAEPLRIHGLTGRSSRRSVVGGVLERVGLDAGAADRYPHELSGGQLQRAALARALVLNPDLLVADEPVSALDVSVQAGVLRLLEDLRTELGLSVVVISHDLGAVREVCDRVAVMYLGELVEVGPTETLFEDPAHPYTRALVSAVPSATEHGRRERVRLTGEVPDPADPPPGCRFHPRCPEVVEPEGYAFAEGVWRSLLDLVVRAEAGRLTPESVAASIARQRVADGNDEPTPLGRRPPGTDGESVDPAGIGPAGIDPADVADDIAAADVDTAVRAAHGLPSPLSDPDAEAVLADALARVADGDAEGARSRLARSFTTPCRERPPRSIAVSEGHVASCHLIPSDGDGDENEGTGPE
ncbi:ATP-binding cassette domain-containing protein [Halorubrum sp. JWXQ-INN 858]|uniref:ABC transporter ATP-binding protein n=1 Tax=Halorubrum sp. JWXQ-INN 858 TaxID=2690782 RepID=UPI00135840BD|nr:oligopeptide/dipeptide ABC transporter ATP-binding protein [Halorubrum sp. JWXQ-INN 858]MWV64448.1 ATP-binding cassette domain-containing protein [Halorubrum sp. JWXQ-INN 858]